MAKFLSSFGVRACFDLYSTCERNPFFDLNTSSDMLGLIIKVVPREEHALLSTFRKTCILRGARSNWRLGSLSFNAGTK